MNRISGILRVGVGAGRARAQGGGRLKRSQRQFLDIKQRQFVDIKQRQQHPNKFTRRLTEYCAIKVL